MSLVVAARLASWPRNHSNSYAIRPMAVHPTAMMPVTNATVVSLCRNDRRSNLKKRSIGTVAACSEVAREVKQSRSDIQTATANGLQADVELYLAVLHDQLEHAAAIEEAGTVANREDRRVSNRAQHLPRRLVVRLVHQQDTASPDVGSGLNPEDDRSVADRLACRGTPDSGEEVAFETSADRQFPVVCFPRNVRPVDQADEIEHKSRFDLEISGRCGIGRSAPCHWAAKQHE